MVDLAKGLKRFRKSVEEQSGVQLPEQIHCMLPVLMLIFSLSVNIGFTDIHGFTAIYFNPVVTLRLHSGMRIGLN